MVFKEGARKGDDCRFQRPSLKIKGSMCVCVYDVTKKQDKSTGYHNILWLVALSDNVNEHKIYSSSSSKLTLLYI